MLRFGTDDLAKDVGKMIVDTDWGVDRAGQCQHTGSELIMNAILRTEH